MKVLKLVAVLFLLSAAIAIVHQFLFFGTPFELGDILKVPSHEFQTEISLLGAIVFAGFHRVSSKRRG